MHTTTPYFIQLCRMLVQQMERVPEEQWESRREEILDGLMADLMKEGLVFDRAFAGQLFAQLALTEVPVEERYSASRVNELREQIRQQAYFSDKLMETLGDRMLWVMGSQ